MNQPDLFAAEPAAPVEVGRVHDCPREPIWWWRGFLLTCYGWSLRVYSEPTEGQAIRACRALLKEDRYGFLKGAFKVERMDFPAGWL